MKKRLLSLHNRIGLKRTYQILFNTYALRISSIILLTRGRAVIKNPAEKGNFAAGHYGVPGAIRTRGLPLRSMAYHVIHGSDVTSNIIPYAE